MLAEEGYLVRIFVGESDKKDGIPLYEWLLLEARKAGLAGGTVIRGIAGFGAHSTLHTSKILELSTDLPIVVEIIDSLHKIETFMPTIESAMQGGLVTIEKAKIRLFK